MPFWTSLTYSSARVIGLEEWKHQHLEAGLPYLPDDRVRTKAGEVEAKLFHAGIEERIAKRPPAEIVHYQIMGTTVRKDGRGAYYLDALGQHPRAEEKDLERGFVLVKLTAVTGKIKPGAAIGRLLDADLHEELNGKLLRNDGAVPTVKAFAQVRYALATVRSQFSSFASQLQSKSGEWATSLRPTFPLALVDALALERSRLATCLTTLASVNGALAFLPVALSDVL
jgi:hypothetical protein